MSNVLQLVEIVRGQEGHSNGGFHYSICSSRTKPPISLRKERKAIAAVTVINSLNNCAGINLKKIKEGSS
ncbi:hypothetical protein EUGRSUZ_F00099 [Eucalyptus grandis]|uniref:Uncharacterized protein n=2 Tax=Eucalyptus grandis TaxID=71139 RepID=A0ACC3KAL8_EUCGR|nr:hypothetical protein EUGRSUZ_F00099 [Eucalyptus grandis]